MTLEFGQELAQEGDFQEDVAKEISVVKGGRISLDHYYSSCCPDEIFRQIYNGYQKALRQRRKLDFDDMLLCCYELFVKRKDISGGCVEISVVKQGFPIHYSSCAPDEVFRQIYNGYQNCQEEKFR